ALGLHVEAIAKEPTAYHGQQMQATFTIINRSDYPVSFSSNINDSIAGKKIKLTENKNLNIDFKTAALMEISQPYWLHEDYFGVFEVQEQELIGKPENPAILEIAYSLFIDDKKIDFVEKLQYKWTDRVDGENYRDISVEPAASMQISEPVFIFSSNEAQNLSVVVDINKEGYKAELMPKLPSGWKIEPEKVQLESKQEFSQQVVDFKVFPPEGASSGNIK